MTNLSGINSSKGVNETQAFLDTESIKDPVVMDPKKTLNVTYMESAKQAYKKRANNVYPLCGLLLAFVFIIWLIGLTMVREFQLADLRKEVKELRDSVEELKMHYADDQLFDELKDFEQKVNQNEYVLHNYDDVPPIMQFDDKTSSEKTYPPLANHDQDLDYSLYDDYVLNPEDEDVDVASDEDMDKIDFSGDVMEAKFPDVVEMDDSKTARFRRSYQELTDAEKSKESKARNGSHSEPPRYHTDNLMHERIFKNENEINPEIRPHHPPATVSPTVHPSNRNQHSDDMFESYDALRLRRPPNKRRYYYDDDDLDQSQDEADGKKLHYRRNHKVNQRAMEVFERDITKKKMSLQNSANVLVAHFHGDTTKHRSAAEYDGNGRLSHPHEGPFTAWSPAKWLPHAGMDAYFPLENGAVTVPENGIYFVYAQVYYHDTHDESSFKVYRNYDNHHEGILHCMTTTYSNVSVNKSNTCYTAGAFRLNQGDKITIKNIGGQRFSLMQHDKSFFGLMKLFDFTSR